MSTADHFLPCAAATALILCITIPLVQRDAVVKKILSADLLQKKRRRDILRWAEKSNQHALQRKRQILARRFHNSHVENNKCDRVEDFFSEKEMKDIVVSIFQENEFPEIVGIEGGGTKETSQEKARQDVVLFLLLGNGKRLIQIPLAKFCMLLAAEFESRLTSTAFCFVADASGGLSTRMLNGIISKAKIDLAVVMQPLWMTSLAILIQKRLFLQQSRLKKIMFALCRLEAWRVRKEVGTNRTVLFFLPGQSFTPQLLPLIQSTFPCERHVFAYDGCFSSVTRSSAPFSPGSAANPIAPLHVPQSQLFYSKMSKLSFIHAKAVEAWVCSVNTFITLKKEEKDNNYLPFVCRLGFLIGQTSSTSDLAVVNVLQYITGSRSRPLEEHVKKYAVGALKDVIREEEEVQYPLPTEKQRVDIEDCIFCHKEILIGDKTLPDTVQPKLEWSLKAAKKMSGCSCCEPGGKEEESITSDDGFEVKQSISEEYNTPMNVTPTYRDGSIGFAFDPTIFTGK